MTKNSFLGFLLILLLVSSCKWPKFSFKPGGKNNEEIPGKSIQVDFFENQAALASSSASITFTEGLRVLMQNQSKMDLVNENGDWQIQGVIRDYQVSPISIQAGSEVAAQNRLTMVIDANWECTLDFEEKPNFDTEGRKSFSAYVDYESTLDFTSVESELQDELIRQLTQDIYDHIFGGKW